MNEHYDEAYLRADLFGDEASRLLDRFVDRLPEGASVLDIGVGQGRNSWPLAARGFRITGIDPSATAVRMVNQQAAEMNLPMKAIQTGFENFQPANSFDVVLCFGLMQILDPGHVEKLVADCRSWLAPDGLLFVTAWHVGDPSFAGRKEEWQEIAPNNFRSPHADPRHRFYLAQRQILEFWPDWEVLHHWEGIGPRHRHADGPEEQHGDVELVLRRAENI